MLKFYHSNKSKMLFLQSTSDVMSRVTKRLTFMGKHKVQRSHNPDPMRETKTQSSAAGATAKVSIVKSSAKTTQNETATKKEVAKETDANQRKRCSYLSENLR
jgi:hypothetical protein